MPADYAEQGMRYPTEEKVKRLSRPVSYGLLRRARTRTHIGVPGGSRLVSHL